MNWAKGMFEMKLNFIDFSDIYKEMMNNGERLELTYNEYNNLIQEEIDNYNESFEEENSIEGDETSILRMEIEEKKEKLRVLEKKEKFLNIEKEIGEEIKAVYITHYYAEVSPESNPSVINVEIILSFENLEDIFINNDYSLSSYENADGLMSLELKEKYYEKIDGDFISYTELWYFPNTGRRGPHGPRKSYILRRMKGRSLNLKEWFDKIYSKWIDFNKEIGVPIFK